MKKKYSGIHILSRIAVRLVWLVGLQAEIYADSEEKVLEQITGCEEFTVEDPRPGGPVINAVDFGLKEHGVPEENVQALQRALAQCKMQQAYKLIIPKGVYRLRWFNDQPVDEQLAYTWALGANPPVTRLIAIEGMKDFILDGQGAEFIVLDADQLSMGAMLYVAHCERVRVENLTFDWDWENRPLAALGFVESVNLEEDFIDFHVPYLRLPPDTRLNRESGTTGKPWDAVINMRPPEVRPWVLADNSPGFGDLIFVSKLDREEVLDPHHLRVWMKDKKALEKARIGQCVNMTFHTNFDPFGVEANYNDHVAFRNIRLYAALNHRAFSADYNRYLEISSVQIVPRPGTGRTKAAHGTFEIHNSRGYFLFQDNIVDTEMDDFMHLSDGFVGGGIELKDNRTLLCERLQFYSARFTLRPDVTIDFFDAAFNPLGFSREVESVEWLSDYYPVKDKQQACLVKFKTDLPDGLKRETILWNKALGTGKYIIRRSKGTTLACRAILTTWPNGIIEDNEFDNVGYSGIQMGLSPFGSRWFTGPGPSNLIIRRNHFKNLNRVQRYNADIGIYKIAGAGCLFHGLLIEENTIENSTSKLLMDLRHVKGLVVRNNRFINPLAPADEGIKIELCEDIFVHGNLKVEKH
jgi:hypothetical protein